MIKKITFIIVYMCITLSLDAKEPFLAMLDSTISNDKQQFKYGKYSFKCSAYGILTLNKLRSNSIGNSICKQKIDLFFRNNPTLQYYSNELLKKGQLYRIEIKEKGCVVYIKGQITLSEILLKEGLAIQVSNFRDEEFLNYFILAQRKARLNKQGIWDSDILKSCMQERF